MNNDRTRQRIAIVAHDNKKQDVADWARFNRDLLAQHDLVATGTTGSVVEEELGLPVVKLLSGPLGGDQQIGSMISEGKIDLLIFFWDPLEPHPHDTDVKALLRIAVVWNIPIACNRATADFLISSPLLGGGYERTRPEYTYGEVDPTVSPAERLPRHVLRVLTGTAAPESAESGLPEAEPAGGQDPARSTPGEAGASPPR